MSDDRYNGAECRFCGCLLVDCETNCTEARQAAKKHGLEAYAWPGGYDIMYFVQEGQEESLICSVCATVAKWRGTAVRPYVHEVQGTIECDWCDTTIPTGDTSVQNGPTFDRDDIRAAYNMYSVLYGWNDYTHGIQARLVAMGYKPTRDEEHLCGLNANSRIIYAKLVDQHHGTGYVHCACCGLDTIGADGVALCDDCTAAECEPWCGACPACRGRACQQAPVDE